jgi:hypothetical protein
MVSVPPGFGTSALGGIGGVCVGSTVGGAVVGVVVGGVVVGVVGVVVVVGVAAGAQAANIRDSAIKVLTTSQRILFLMYSSFII